MRMKCKIIRIHSKYLEHNKNSRVYVILRIHPLTVTHSNTQAAQITRQPFLWNIKGSHSLELVV